MMRKMNKKGFTIVELVIVIAVIAVLAAVLIPTFSGIIEKARISNDTQTAASLSIELLTITNGEEIKDEATLMSALEKVENRAAKLTPGSAKWGYQYWYDMDAQTVIVATAEDIQKKVAQSAATLAAEDSANTSFRDVFDGGYYLIGIGTLAEPLACGLDVFKFIDSMASADDYALLLNTLAAVVENEEDDSDIAEAILQKVQVTTIRTAGGVFYPKNVPADAKRFEYITTTGSTLGNKHFEYADNSISKVEGDEAKAPAPDGTVTIPSNIERVDEGALNYKDSNVVVKLPITNASQAESLLAPSASNAKLDIGGSEHTIDGTELVNGAGEPVAVLAKKLPFEDFAIAFDEVDGAELVNGTIYVAYRNGTLKLNATNVVDGKLVLGEDSKAVDSWQVVGDGFGTVTVNDKGEIDFKQATLSNNVCEFTVKASATNKNGEACEREATVVVAFPLSATVTIPASQGDQKINLPSNTAQTLTINAKGDAASFELTKSNIAVTYSTGNGDNNFDTTAAFGGAAVLSTDNGKVTCGKNKLIFSLSDPVEESDGYEFSLAIDGCLTTSLKAKVYDQSSAIFQTNFKHERTLERLFYIGSGNTIKLSDLFNVGDRFTAGTATINIYDKVNASGTIHPLYLANNNDDNLTVKVNGNEADSYTITPDNFKDITLGFDFNEEDNESEDGGVTLSAYIEIVPSDLTQIPTIIKFEVVNGAVNVTDADALFAAGSHVVLQSKITLTEDHNGKTVDLGDNHLYGNGYVIDATTYTAGDEKYTYTYTYQQINLKSWCTKHNREYGLLDALCGSYKVDKEFLTQKSEQVTGYKSDVAFIAVVGGKVDNVYINGPVYSELQYEKSEYSENNQDYARLPYYVSGIKAMGAATIQHSYVSGFRQPVQIASSANETVKIINTTLRGGNYANMTIASGNIHLTDVTTIQDQNGMKATVGNTSLSVTGMGIAIEKTALTSTMNFTIDGYLDQYNWVKNTQTATMPTIRKNGKELKTADFFGYIFNGFSGIVDMGSLKEFVVQDKTQAATDATSRTEGYVNAGIVIVEIGTDAEIAAINTANVNMKDKRDLSANMSKINKHTLDLDFSQNLVTDASLKALLDTFSIPNSIRSVLGMSGKFCIWGYIDARDIERDGLKIVFTGGKDPTQNDLVLDDSKEYNSDAKDSVIYRGYYDNYGVYASEYVASANSDNILTKTN